MVNVKQIKYLIKNILTNKNYSKERKVKEITNLVNPSKNRRFTKTEASKLYLLYNNKVKYNNSKKFNSSKYIKNKNK
jgi:hypothetical protein